MIRLRRRQVNINLNFEGIQQLNVNIDRNEVSYPILIGDNLKGKVGELISQYHKGKKVVIVTDENVGQLYLPLISEQLEASGYDIYKYTLPPGEKAKTNQYLQKGYNYLLKKEFNRDSLIVALGGGVVGDLAGYLAATYMRGIKYIQIPTSLIAQVDSSVGGKTAINHNYGKNLIGSFYHPEMVIIDIEFLKTLPVRHFNNGMAEVIKYALIRDIDFFNYLRENSEEISNLKANKLKYIINASCQHKVNIVNEDEKDKNKRRLLNFGHTIGHALESIFNNREQGYLHGEAVALGMYLSSCLSENKGYLSSTQRSRIEILLKKYNLPVQLKKKVKIESIWEKIKFDKKRGNKGLAWILLDGIGESFICKDIGLKELKGLNCLLYFQCNDTIR